MVHGGDFADSSSNNVILDTASSAAIGVLVVLMGCSSEADTALSSLKREVSVRIHGMNYPADPFTFVVTDPKDASNVGGGEHVGPFSAGGIMCCFKLPKKWKPGLKVQVRTTHWLPKNEKGELPEVEQTQTVEVPPYADGKAGELWVLRTAKDDIALVSSGLQPDHPQWPGKVKGWPVPSREYMRERWELQRQLAENSVNNFRRSIAKLALDPKAQRHSAWKVQKQYQSEEVAKFKGPDDPEYARYLKAEYDEGLRHSEALLNSLMREKP